MYIGYFMRALYMCAYTSPVLERCFLVVKGVREEGAEYRGSGAGFYGALVAVGSGTRLVNSTSAYLSRTDAPTTNTVVFVCCCFRSRPGSLFGRTAKYLLYVRTVHGFVFQLLV